MKKKDDRTPRLSKDRSQFFALKIPSFGEDEIEMIGSVCDDANSALRQAEDYAEIHTIDVTQGDVILVVESVFKVTSTLNLRTVKVDLLRRR